MSERSCGKKERRVDFCDESLSGDGPATALIRSKFGSASNELGSRGCLVVTVSDGDFDAFLSENPKHARFVWHLDKGGRLLHAGPFVDIQTEAAEGVPWPPGAGTFESFDYAAWLAAGGWVTGGGAATEFVRKNADGASVPLESRFVRELRVSPETFDAFLSEHPGAGDFVVACGGVRRLRANWTLELVG